MDNDLIFAAVCAGTVLVTALYLILRGRTLGNLLSASLTGPAALFILERFSEPLSLDVPLNSFNICGSAVLGVPYTIILVLL